MLDHVTIGVSHRDASARFYDTVLATVGIERTSAVDDFVEWGDFSFAADGRPVTRGLHVAFTARSRERVDAFWRAGVDAGHRSDGEPGPRPQYGGDYYGGFLLDPDGNSVEAVHTGGGRRGPIHHVWIRVRDVEASRRFYELVGEHAGFRLNPDVTDRAQFLGEHGSLSLVGSERPTEHVHVAFPVAENARVDAFHAAALAAGYRDNGAPGERRAYHEGYYGAFVFDPDGHNVELVNHNR